MITQSDTVYIYMNILAHTFFRCAFVRWLKCFAVCPRPQQCFVCSGAGNPLGFSKPRAHHHLMLYAPTLSLEEEIKTESNFQTRLTSNLPSPSQQYPAFMYFSF